MRRLLAALIATTMLFSPVVASATTIFPLDRATILVSSPFDVKVEFDNVVAEADVSVTVNGKPAAEVLFDNLLVTAPRPRNPLLADAFKRAGIVERTARGIDTIFYEQLRNGRPAPSYARSNDATVSVVIPGGAANLDFVRLLVTEAQQGRDLALDELLILNALWQARSLTTDEAARLVQKPEAEARAALSRLVEAGLVEERGQKKGRTWHLSAATYRLLGDKAGYVRQRGFEPLQQEQMVLQYVEKHGRITRRETAELCRIASHQARDLLLRLVRRGGLVMRGALKGAFYERAGKNMEDSKSAPKDSKTPSDDWAVKPRGRRK